MNIESLLYKINLFEELVIESGFKRDIEDYKQAISQSQNQNLPFLKDLSSKIKLMFKEFENNSLNEELSLVLRDTKPFTSMRIESELEELDSDPQIDAQKYYQKMNNILIKLHKTLNANEHELNQAKSMFKKYTTDDKKYEGYSESGVMSIVFKDLKSTGTIKEFSKVLSRWNRTLITYHTLLKSDSPKEVSLIEIQNGSIDVIFNIDIDVAIDLAEIFKTGLKVYGAYLLYKSEKAREIIDSYMGNKKLIEMENKREEMMLENIQDSVKRKIIEQHEENLVSDGEIGRTSVPKKADEVARVVSDHIIKGNEIKLLTPPPPQEEEEKEKEDGEEIEKENINVELRRITAIVRERYKELNDKDKQLLLERYSIKEDEVKD